jgi:hypothetical protein
MRIIWAMGRVGGVGASGRRVPGMVGGFEAQGQSLPTYGTLAWDFGVVKIFYL